MSLEFSYRLQLLTVQDPAVGFLVKSLDELCAGLQTLSPLAANLKLPYTKSGTLFTTSAGVPSLHQQVRCTAYNSGTVTLATATVTNITFDTELFDIGGMHDNATLTGRLTVPTGGDGLYLVIGILPFVGNAVGQRQMRIKLNGTNVNPLCIMPAGIIAGNLTLTHTLLIPAVAGDFFELDAYQDSGGNLGAGDGGTSRIQLTAMKVAAA